VGDLGEKNKTKTNKMQQSPQMPSRKREVTLAKTGDHT
jgi:hypothetical protein